MKINNDNQFTYLDGKTIGNYYELFKKNSKTLIGVCRENESQTPNYICDIDTSLILKK